MTSDISSYIFINHISKPIKLDMKNIKKIKTKNKNGDGLQKCILSRGTLKSSTKTTIV